MTQNNRKLRKRRQTAEHPVTEFRGSKPCSRLRSMGRQGEHLPPHSRFRAATSVGRTSSGSHDSATRELFRQQVVLTLGWRVSGPPPQFPRSNQRQWRYDHCCRWILIGPLGPPFDRDQNGYCSCGNSERTRLLDGWGLESGTWRLATGPCPSPTCWLFQRWRTRSATAAGIVPQIEIPQRQRRFSRVSCISCSLSSLRFNRFAPDAARRACRPVLPVRLGVRFPGDSVGFLDAAESKARLALGVKAKKEAQPNRV
jgi:hypothetical protein